MRAIAAVCAVLALATACGGGDGAESETPVTTGNASRGEEVYLEAGCGSCHTFEAAGSMRNVGPNLDEAVQMYDEAFIRESIVAPDAYIEKGSAGGIGGEQEYGTEMPAYGPDESPPQQLSEQELADLVAFLLEAKT